MGLIRTILIILLFYYGFKILARLLAPILMRYAAKKVQQKFKDQMRQSSHYTDQRRAKKEGEVHIQSKKSSLEKNNSDTVGDYVDFEEVED